jgi:hypothetical protein
MATKNDKATAQTTHKEEWEQPEMIELDINKTESGVQVGIEVDLIAPLLGKES